MTSAVGQRLPSSSLPAGAGRAARRGFTLLEIILALAIVALLGGLVAVNYPNLLSRQRLEEGAFQMEGLLRMARAESANLGKRLRLEFDSSGAMNVTCEDAPLSEPGTFRDYAAANWAANPPNDLLYVRRCTLSDSSAEGFEQSSDAASSDESAGTVSAITFYPDGTCDAATLELASTDASDARTVVLKIEPATGGMSTQLMSPEQLQEYRQGMEAGE